MSLGDKKAPNEKVTFHVIHLHHTAGQKTWCGSLSDTPKEIFWISATRVCGKEKASFGGLF